MLIGCMTPVRPGDAPDDARTDAPSDGRVDVWSGELSVDAGDSHTDERGERATDATRDAPMGPAFCATGTAPPGAVVPPGFCIRQFSPHTQTPRVPGAVEGPRTLAFASNGDLFVAAPMNGAPGGSGGGPGAILVITDADHDLAGETHVFAAGIPDVHGLVVADDAVYFTTIAGVWRTDYVPGQLAERPATRTRIAALTNTAWRWTHGLARSTGGHLYVTSGVYGATCPDPDVGSVSEVTASGLRLVARGFRNPMYARCHFRDEVCALSELGEDGAGSWGAREKIILLREGTDYGYPCCNTTGQPAQGSTMNCFGVTAEESEMPIGDTPFGLDWEHGSWPLPYSGGLFVAKHGSFYSTPLWHGVGIWWTPAEAGSHAPGRAFALFVDGFGPASPQLRRPADVTFARDGRLFFVDDLGGGVYWVAPETLHSPWP